MLLILLYFWRVNTQMYSGISLGISPKWGIGMNWDVTHKVSTLPANVFQLH